MLAPAHLQMKGHKEDICNEEQQVVTTLQFCTHQTEVDTCDRYILISTCLVQKSDVLTTAWQPNVKCFTSQHEDAQKPWLEKALGFTF